ncbi:MAG TPA: UDP-N-acetylmuramoyl-L-alanine--D-glutamate ligase [Capillimicrobium sp.]|jgi:UDP-N-acetylmuramoylalanine--D-glutamate ligase
MRVSELEGARVGLWGAGREAAAAFRALTAPAEVVVATDAPADEAARARFPGARFVAGREAVDALRGCDVVVRSPGISRYRDDVAAVRDAGVALTTGTNLWMAEHAGERVVAITGTKGKSTTASLVHRLAVAAGARAELAGNIGRPLLDLLHVEEAPDLWVLELSSYQTADLDRAPTVAAVVNLFREHLDWHGSEERYFADKLRLLELEPQIAVLNGRDKRLLALAPPAERVPRRLFGVPGGFDVSPDGEVVVGPAGAAELELSGTNLIGEHNALNVAAALAIADAAGALPADSAGALAWFQPLPHRLERVAVDGGLTFVDDSISTTPESAVAALQAVGDVAVALLAGGQDREQDYTPLADAVARDGRVRAVICLPDNGGRVAEALRDRGAGVPIVMADTLEEAVHAARAALADDLSGTVLLSPAAPSYGRFADFTERGARFRAAAEAVARG